MNNFSRSRNGLKKPIFGVLGCGGGKFGARHAVDIHTFPFNQAALGDDQVDMQLKAQTTPEGVCGVDLANPDPGIDFINDLLHGLRPDPKQHFQQSAVVVEKRAKGIVGGHRYVEMGNFQDVFGDVVNPIINGDLSAGGVKAGFAGEGNAMLSIASPGRFGGRSPLRGRGKASDAGRFC